MPILSIFGKKKKAMLYHIRNGKISETCYMEELTDDIEEILDSHNGTNGPNSFVFIKNTQFHTKDIVLYGDIDLNNKIDINYIKHKKLINEDKGFTAYTQMNYDTGEIILEKDEKPTWYQSWNALNNFKMRYCEIGKPKKIFIYIIRRKHHISNDL